MSPIKSPLNRSQSYQKVLRVSDYENIVNKTRCVAIVKKTFRSAQVTFISHFNITFVFLCYLIYVPVRDHETHLTFAMYSQNETYATFYVPD